MEFCQEREALALKRVVPRDLTSFALQTLGASYHASVGRELSAVCEWPPSATEARAVPWPLLPPTPNGNPASWPHKQPTGLLMIQHLAGRAGCAQLRMVDNVAAQCLHTAR